MYYRAAPFSILFPKKWTREIYISFTFINLHEFCSEKGGALSFVSLGVRA